MTEILLNTIINDMNKYLNNYQLEKLKDVLKYNLFILNENNNKEKIDYLDKFFSIKILEGCSNETIKNYRLVLTRFLNDINKKVKTINTDDIRNYLIEYQSNNNVSKASLDNMRRIISSFFFRSRGIHSEKSM